MNAKERFTTMGKGATPVVAWAFLIGMLAASTARAQEAVPEIVVGFSGPVPLAFDQVYEADAAGIVSATLSYTGAGALRGAICGYVGSDRESLQPDKRATSATMLASASIQCRHNGGCAPRGVYLPNASMSMPISGGQFWTVVSCGGNGDARVYFHRLTIGLRER